MSKPIQNSHELNALIDRLPRGLFDESPERRHCPRLILKSLASHASAKGGWEAFPSVERLAIASGCNERTTDRMLDWLEDHDLISWVGERDNSTNIYRPNIELIQRLVSEAESRREVAKAEEMRKKALRSKRGRRERQSKGISATNVGFSATEVVSPRPPEPDVVEPDLNLQKNRDLSFSSMTLPIEDSEKANSGPAASNVVQFPGVPTPQAEPLREFLAVYPIQPGDTEAKIEKALAAQLREASIERIMDGTRRYVAFMEATHASGFARGWRNAANFLRDEDWTLEWIAPVNDRPFTPSQAEAVRAEARELSDEERDRRRAAKEYPYDDLTDRRLNGDQWGAA